MNKETYECNLKVSYAIEKNKKTLKNLEKDIFDVKHLYARVT